MRILQQFLFLFKSKYRRKWRSLNSLSSFLLTLFYFLKLVLRQESRAVVSRSASISRSIFVIEVLGFGLTLFALMTVPAVGGTEVTSAVNHNVNVSPIKNLSPVESSNCEPVSASNDTTTPPIPPCHGHGDCVSNACVCYEGWSGFHCEYCYGKVRYICRSNPV